MSYSWGLPRSMTLSKQHTTPTCLQKAPAFWEMAFESRRAFQNVLVTVTGSFELGFQFQNMALSCKISLQNKRKYASLYFQIVYGYTVPLCLQGDLESCLCFCLNSWFLVTTGPPLTSSSWLIATGCHHNYFIPQQNILSLGIYFTFNIFL